MIDPNSIKLDGIKSAIAVANTPSFLLRKAKNDIDAYEFSKKYKPKEIYSAIKTAIKTFPTTLDEVAIPYALLAALYHSGDGKLIWQARKLNAPYHKWYGFLANSFADQFMPTTRKQFDARRISMRSSVCNISPTHTSQQSLQLKAK